VPFPPYRKHWGPDDHFVDWGNEPGPRTSLWQSNVSGGMSLNWGSFLKWTLVFLIITAMSFIVTNVILVRKTALTFRLASSSPPRYLVQNTLENKRGKFRDAPRVVMIRGLEYRIQVNAVGHPLVVTSQPGGGPAAFETALSKSRDRGIISFLPDATTPDTVFYESTTADGLGGVIDVFDSTEDAEQAPPP
jgi:hypothetical protein